MSVHLELLVDKITLLRIPKAVQRVAEFLVRQGCKEDGPANFELPYQKIVIAKSFGFSPALSRSFAPLRQFGGTVTGMSICIKDVTKLSQLLQ